MNRLFEELDYQDTPMGELVLRRRRMVSMNGLTVYEVKLGETYLMTSLFHASETALADIALGELGGSDWEVVVGGLGLGYTAAAALAFEPLKRLLLVEALEPVINWHKAELVPNSDLLNRDGRCLFYQADFFALARGPGFDPETAGRRFDAILLDIDHSPDDRLDETHGNFYTEKGLAQLRSHLKPGGVFALWSNDPPREQFLDTLGRVFDRAEGRVIEFDNPLQQNITANGIYLARRS